MDPCPSYNLRREVARKVIPLTQYNMTFVSTNEEECNLLFPERCPMPACFDLPRCAAHTPGTPAAALAHAPARAGAGAGVGSGCWSWSGRAMLSGQGWAQARVLAP